MKKILICLLGLFIYNANFAQVLLNQSIEENDFIILNLENSDNYGVKLPFANSSDRVLMAKNNPHPEDGTFVLDPDNYKLYYFKLNQGSIIPDNKTNYGTWIQVIDENFAFNDVDFINNELSNLADTLDYIINKYIGISSAINWKTFPSNGYNSNWYKKMNLKYGIDYYGNLHIKGDFELYDSIFFHDLESQTNINPNFTFNYYNYPFYRSEFSFNQICDTTIATFPSGTLQYNYEQATVARYEAIPYDYSYSTNEDDKILLNCIPVYLYQNGTNAKLCFDNLWLGVDLQKFSSNGCYKFYINTVFYRRN